MSADDAKPTIREVANRAGVSPATVSRVLNGYPFVSEQVRRRVLTVIDELGYRPDVLAAGMRTGATRAIGFVVSDFSNPLFARIARSIDRRLEANGYSMVLANSDGDPRREAAAMAAFEQRRIDGVIVSVADEKAEEHLRAFARKRAVVLLDREVAGLAVDSVVSDHRVGMRQAVAHLTALGHTRIALIVGSPSQLPGRVRLEAFREALAATGLRAHSDLIRAGRLSQETGLKAARELLTLRSPPTAVIAGANRLFVGLVEVIRELDIDVPRQLSVVTSDDIDLARLSRPAFDVITRDHDELGRVAAELLLARLADPAAPPRHERLPTGFEIRASSASPPYERCM